MRTVALLGRFAAVVGAVALLAPTGVAEADGPVVLGGGSGIVIDNDAYCTLTTIGTDSRGDLIGFTSAHCGGPGATVAAESDPAAGVVGTMVAGNEADGQPLAVCRAIVRNGLHPGKPVRKELSAKDGLQQLVTRPHDRR